MNVKGNLLIFSSDIEERTDIRKLNEKKLQIILDENNELPKFEFNENEYIKRTAEKEVEKLFEISNFYIEQLYTWGDPNYYTKSDEIIVTFLVIVNKNNINNMPKNYNFYSINIINSESSSLQNVILKSESKEIEYKIATIVKRIRDTNEYTNKLIEKSAIDEFTAIIIHTGIKRLRNRVENTNIAFSFLDREFTISELQQIYEIILDKKLVAANFRKKINPMVKRTEILVKDSAHRPSNKYIFNEEFLHNWV